MGYVPDSQAQALRSRKTRMFGLVLPAATNPVFARVIMALEEQAHELGYDILIAHSLNQIDRESSVIRRFLARRVDGLFLSPVYRMEPSAPIYDELLRKEIPTVLLGHRAPFCERFPNVATDDLAASQTATRHLIELGHKRIAFFNGLPAAPSSQERFEGYRRTLREAGLDPDDQLVFKAGNTIEEGEKAALQMLNENTRATALHAVNDLVAIGACNVFLSQGLRIPEDLSVVGFGNILISEYYRVPLTTMRQPKQRLGVAAMELMSQLLRGEQPASRRLAAEIIIRQSTAPPAP
jgi:DNA-binding LacI/PurR family transcriptional regulator